MKTWLKGGLWGIGIFIINWIIFGFLDNYICKGAGCFFNKVVDFIFFIPLLLSKTLIYQKDLLPDVKVFIVFIVMLIFAMIFYFGIGALIGYLIEKYKSKSS